MSYSWNTEREKKNLSLTPKLFWDPVFSRANHNIKSFSTLFDSPCSSSWFTGTTEMENCISCFLRQCCCISTTTKGQWTFWIICCPKIFLSHLVALWLFFPHWFQTSSLLRILTLLSSYKPLLICRSSLQHMKKPGYEEVWWSVSSHLQVHYKTRDASLVSKYRCWNLLPHSVLKGKAWYNAYWCWWEPINDFDVLCISPVHEDEGKIVA